MSTSTGIPRGWTVSPLGDVVEPSGTRNPKREGDGSFQYVDVDALDNTRQVITNPKTLAKADAPSRARMLIKDGDVLFCLVRPYLKNIAIVPLELDGEVASTAYSVLRPRSGLDSQFLFYQLQQESFIHAIPTYGNSPPSARDDEFLQMPVRFSPPLEQHRIVAKIEELFSDLDAGVAALTRVRAKLKRYRASVLKAAVEGRLTAAWRAAHPDVEPAEKLLERILTERRAKWEAEQLRKYAEKGKEPPKGWKAKYKGPFEPDSKVCRPLPAGWTWATVDACAWEVTVGHVGPMKEKYEDVGFPFLRSQNVRPLRFDPLGLKFIPADFHAALAKSRLMGGELLVVRSGNVGEACVYPTDAGEANCADLVITRPLKGIVAQYLAVFVASPTGIRSVLGKRTGSALPHFNVGAMACSPIPIPPFAEQTEIVAEVDRRLSVVDAVETEVEHALQRAGRLRQSILKRAFEGGLLPQDPSDEPAEELLENLRAEDGKAPAKPAAKKRLARSATTLADKKPARKATVRCGKGHADG